MHGPQRSRDARTCRVARSHRKTLRGSRAVLAMILLLFWPREDIVDRYQDAEASF